jgi:hypothetical protein
VGSQDSADLSGSGAGNTIAVHSDGGDTAATSSTTAARGTSVCPAAVPLAPAAFPDVLQSDSQPCGSARALRGGSLRASVTTHAGDDAITAVLATVATPSVLTAEGGALTNYAVASEGSVCAGASGDGCIQSMQYRSSGTISLAQLPTNLAAGSYPTGYDATKGLVQLTGLSDSVSAEAGIGAGAPATSLAGTIRYYNGTATYGTITLAPGAAQAIPLGGPTNPGVIVTDNDFHGGSVQIVISATLSTGGTATADAGATSCGSACRSSASSTSRSPITGSIRYTVTTGGAVVTDLTMTVDLGTVLAKSSYTASPTGA